MKKLILIYLSIYSLNAASYYVATNGNNANPGSSILPWLTIQHAADTAVAGDVVTIKQGIYHEYVTNNVSGSVGNYITFQGERSGDAWLTIIDPSSSYSSNWIAATEIGSGVYKQTSMPFMTGELTIDGKKVASIYDTNTVSTLSGIYTPDRTLGIDWLALSSSAVVTNSLCPTYAFQWWDSVGALWSSTTNTTYLRLKDGSDPNGLNIRCSAKTAGTFDIRYPVIKINSAYIKWQDVLIRGAQGGIFLDQATANHVIIQNNKIVNGASRILMGFEVSDCLISGNELTSDWYGLASLGAWEGGNSNYTARANMYTVSKYMMADSLNTYDDGITLYNAGGNNVICNNYCHDTAGEHIFIYAGASNRTTNTLIYGNILKTSSDVGLLNAEYNSGTKIYNNTFLDNNTNFRPHHMDAGSDDRLVYFYRNLLWETNGVGSQIYFHYFNSTPDSYFPTFWIYHNSFSGGRVVINPSSYIAGSGGATNTHFLNNVFNGTYYVLGDSFGGADYSFWTNSLGFGSFDYNLITPPLVTYPSTNNPAWWQVHNIVSSSNIWSVSSVPSFILPSGSAGVGSALDLTQSFIVGGVTYSALPFTSVVKSGNGFDIGALKTSTVLQSPIIRAGKVKSK